MFEFLAIAKLQKIVQFARILNGSVSLTALNRIFRQKDCAQSAHEHAYIILKATAQSWGRKQQKSEIMTPRSYKVNLCSCLSVIGTWLAEFPALSVVSARVKSTSTITEVWGTASPTKTLFCSSDGPWMGQTQKLRHRHSHRIGWYWVKTDQHSWHEIKDISFRVQSYFRIVKYLQ